MNKTKIEWADYTWNPVTGCWHGCAYCYARKIATRYGKELEDNSATNLTYPRIHCLDNKIKGNPYPYIFQPTLHRYRLEEPAQKTKPQTIFVCSMADLFGDWVPDEWIEAVFAACERAPQHTYIFLTKNSDRYLRLHLDGKLPTRENMWYGTTVTGIPSEYLFTWGEVNTFFSIEPLLGPLPVAIYEFGAPSGIIIGPETGNRKGKVTPKKKWVDDLCIQADVCGASVFMKDKLAPIVGDKNMRRELPWEVAHV